MENIERKTLTQEDAGMFIADRVLNPTKASVEIAKNTTLKSVFQTKMKSREDALDWISNGDINNYMSEHHHDVNPLTYSCSISLQQVPPLARLVRFVVDTIEQL